MRLPAGFQQRIDSGENPMKVYRAYHGFPQHAVARAVGASTGTICQFENGRVKCSDRLRQRIGEFLSMDIKLLDEFHARMGRKVETFPR